MHLPTFVAVLMAGPLRDLPPHYTLTHRLQVILLPEMTVPSMPILQAEKNTVYSSFFF